MDEANPFIETTHPSLEGRMVNSLMKVDKIEWDSEVISDVLNDRDQALVWKIPLSEASAHDDWFWLKDSKGMFTVKSAYRLQHGQSGQPIHNFSSDLWKKLWTLNLPPKVLNFLWRVCSNCLPTKFMLSTKHVQIDTSCPLCSAAPETALHLLVRCSFAKSCWQQTCVPIVAPAAMTFGSWFEEGFSRWSDVVCVEAAMTLWALWKVRNEVVWNSVSPSFDEVIHMAKVNYSDWCNAQRMTPLQSSRTLLNRPKSQEKFSKLSGSVSHKTAPNSNLDFDGVLDIRVGIKKQKQKQKQKMSVCITHFQRCQYTLPDGGKENVFLWSWQLSPERALATKLQTNWNFDGVLWQAHTNLGSKSHSSRSEYFWHKLILSRETIPMLIAALKKNEQNVSKFTWRAASIGCMNSHDKGSAEKEGSQHNL
ncbi:hypothetical protein F8388_023768 [Cannabis sativa]|uniref:Reverse transcriptase zinc-binding domain-containing protein n=1 Tax=Cannabis sativa TaxID=3483 RepID=A0A7J6G9V6_CANSA|nr:hypothetical protein F8388_023768 [Cannabis sativa]